jgi:hypothetical protein
MSILLLAVLALSALAFGLLGYVSGKRNSPELRFPLVFAVVLCVIIAAADVLSGFKIGMSHIVGPWLIGVGAGFLRRRSTNS